MIDKWNVAIDDEIADTVVKSKKTSMRTSKLKLADDSVNAVEMAVIMNAEGAAASVDDGGAVVGMAVIMDVGGAAASVDDGGAASWVAGSTMADVAIFIDDGGAAAATAGAGAGGRLGPVYGGGAAAVAVR